MKSRLEIKKEEKLKFIKKQELEIMKEKNLEIMKYEEKFEQEEIEDYVFRCMKSNWYELYELLF